MHKEQQGHTALFSLHWIRRLTRFFPTLPRHGQSLRWLMPVAAVLCLSFITPAPAAEEARTAGTAHAAKKAAAPAAKTNDARLPGDDVAEGIIARTKPSDKDNAAVLLPLTGTWVYQESFWTDPKAEPAHANGVATNEMVMDSHYLSSKSAGSLNLGREQIPFEAQELIGFDNAKKSLSFVEADTLTTGITIGTGKFEETARAAPVKGKNSEMKTGSATDGKDRIIREAGRFTNPLTGAEQDFRSELTFVDADTYKRTVFTVHGSGRETKLIETIYTRRK